MPKTLITLMVIGVVAAMTIPSLVQSYKKKVTVTKVKKTLSILSQASKLAQAEYGNINTQEGKDYLKKLSPYLKIKRNCTGQQNCVPTNYVNMLADKDTTKPSMWFCNHNRDFNTTPCIGNKYILENGMILYNVTGQENFAENKLYVFVDINGEHPPNRNGYDLFGFILEKEGVIPACDKAR